MTTTKTLKMVGAMLISTAMFYGCGVQGQGEEGAADDLAATSSAFTVGGLIAAKWNATGGANGPLGAATSNETTTAFNTGRYNTFQFGRILWKFQAPAAFETHGQIDGAYGSFGWEWGMLGFPSTDEFQNGTRRENRFDQGNLYWKSSTGAWPVITSTAFQFTATSNLKAQGKPQFSFNFSDTQTGTCMKSVVGQGFTPNATVTFYLNNPDTSSAVLLKTADSAGKFNFNWTVALGDCIGGSSIKKLNGVATIEARDAAGHRAVYGATTTTGNAYSGTP